MIRLVFYPLLFLCTIICGSQIQAQQSNAKSKPLFVPFQVDGKWGLMDTLGHEVKALGFCKSISIKDDFSYYLIWGNAGTPRYWLMDSRSGDRIDLGELKSADPVLKIGDIWYYHFEKDNKTVLASPVTRESITLDQRYGRIEVMVLHDLKGEEKESYLVAFDDDYMGNILSAEDHFKKAAQVSPFEKIEVINAIVKKDYFMKTFPIGFAVEKIKKDEDSIEAEDKVLPPPKSVEYPSLSEFKKGKRLPKIKPPAPVEAPRPVPISQAPRDDSEPHSSEIFDFRLASKGNVPANDSVLTALFGAKVILERNRPVSVAMGGGIIKNGMGGDQSVDLNSEFAIKRLTQKVSGATYRHVYYLVRKQDDQTFTELISDDDALFEWASHRGNKLISIWFNGHDNNLKAYFDYNGIVLPKNKLMIPSKYYGGEMMKPYLFH